VRLSPDEVMAVIAQLLEGMARGVEDATPEGHTFTATQVAAMIRETSKRLPDELKWALEAL
jgi:hypothetical protein